MIIENQSLIHIPSKQIIITDCPSDSLDNSSDLFVEVGSAIFVKDSPIHGKGTFALRDLNPGHIILHLDRDILSAKERHPWNTRNRDVIPHFINHSCDANCALAISETTKSVVVIVTRFIPADAEVALDYSLIEVGGKLIPCLCGTDNCRGNFPINRGW